MSMLIIAALLLASNGPKEDRTAIALERCLASPAAAATPPEVQDDDEADEEVQEEQPAVQERPDGRTTCLDNARLSYDRRVIGTYRSLMKKASPEVAEWLAQTNQAWIGYRQTMTSEVDAVAAARDHAQWLEGLRDR